MGITTPSSFGIILFKRHENAGNVLPALRSRFDQNLDATLGLDQKLWQLVELKARVVPAVAEILRNHEAISATQKVILCIYDEVFADIVISSYLAACGLDKPGRMTLRRGLELGIASVYLWDNPHLFWGWKEQDKDLNFNEMIEHLADVILKLDRMRLSYQWIDLNRVRQAEVRTASYFEI